MSSRAARAEQVALRTPRRRALSRPRARRAAALRGAGPAAQVPPRLRHLPAVLHVSRLQFLNLFSSRISILGSVCR